MSEFPLTITFQTSYEHDQYIREQAENFDPEDFGWMRQPSDTDDKIELINVWMDDLSPSDRAEATFQSDPYYAAEMLKSIGLTLGAEYSEITTQHDASHTGAIAYCETGLCILA